MCKRVSASAVRYLPEIEGAVKFLDGVGGAIDSHLAGRAIRLEIVSCTKRGDVRQQYGCRLIFGRDGLDFVTLTKELPGGEEHEAAQYTVKLDVPSCQCRDFIERAHRRESKACKHVKAARKVCRILGA